MALYTGMAGSPITYLTSGMSETATTATVSDGTALPDAPNLCTIGFGENIETIRYGAKVGNNLSDITRGIEGVPQAWDVGTEVARFFTAYDHNELIAEIARLEQERVTHQAETITDDVHGLYTRLGDLRIINFTLNANSSVKLKFSGDVFMSLLLMQGNQSNVYGAFVLQGYGAGGTRYRVGEIQKGEAISVSVDGEGERSFTVSNTSPVNSYCRLVMFAGSPPEII